MKSLFIILTVLQSLFAALEQKTLQSEIAISIADAQTQPITYLGHIAMHGRQFALEMFNMEAAYDGSTLYMYSEDTDELTLTTPSEEELIQANPFLYAQALLPVCKHVEKVAGDNTQITLTPDDLSTGISKFVLRVVTATLLPVSIEIHEVDSKITSLRLTKAQYIDTLPIFTIEKEGALINDLR